MDNQSQADLVVFNNSGGGFGVRFPWIGGAMSVYPPLNWRELQGNGEGACTTARGGIGWRGVGWG